MLSSYALILSVNFGSQINLKLNLSIDLYWQSSCGKPLYDSVPLKEIKLSWAVIINRNLIKGVEKYLRGVQKEAGTCKIDSVIDHMEKNVAFICMSLTLKGKCSSESSVAF